MIFRKRGKALVPISDRIEIDLHPSRWRRMKPRNRWQRAIYYARHPIHAFMAYQVVNPDPPNERQTAIFFSAVVHGIVLWVLTLHT
jgi:hypothetical protein